MKRRTVDSPEPPSLQSMVTSARRIEWLSVVYFATVVGVMAVAMRGSQAMKTVWLEDVLSLIPPIAFLVSSRVARRPRDAEYPEGYHRAKGIAFLCGAVALLGMGLFLLVDGALVLVRQEHPTIGTTELFGQQVWDGWFMLAALAYSGIPTVILGRIKSPMAVALHDKALYSDGVMNSADWKTAGAGALGIVGIYYGMWWADAAAAIFISIDILHDGWRELRQCVGDLMDHMPRTVDRSEPDPLVARVGREVERTSWVSRHRLVLREKGRLIGGSVEVVPGNGTVAVARIDDLTETLRRIHWRLRDIEVVTVARIDQAGQRKAKPRSSSTPIMTLVPQDRRHVGG